jgi:predicted small secreted protein
MKARRYSISVIVFIALCVLSNKVLAQNSTRMKKHPIKVTSRSNARLAVEHKIDSRLLQAIKQKATKQKQQQTAPSTSTDEKGKLEVNYWKIEEGGYNKNGLAIIDITWGGGNYVMRQDLRKKNDPATGKAAITLNGALFVSADNKPPWK